jgi:hypothetical protein
MNTGGTKCYIEFSGFSWMKRGSKDVSMEQKKWSV